MSLIETPKPHITFPSPVTEKKGWGCEIILVNCIDYCSKFLCFKAHSSSSLHFHDKKHETWFVLEGEIRLTWIDTDLAQPHVKVLKTGEMVDIPRLCPHRVEALIDTRILEVSTTHFDGDSFRVGKGDSQKSAGRCPSLKSVLARKS